MSAKFQTWTAGQVLQWMSDKFSAIERSSPRLDAQLLLCHVLQISRVALYTQLDRPLDPKEREELRTLARRRMAGEPVAYILNRKDWHSFSLYVDRRVLIPRPETETLFDLSSAWLSQEAFETFKEGTGLCVVDLCTGSGCLALAFAKAFPQARVIGVDLSSEALEVARLNAASLSLHHIEWLHADVLSENVWQQIQDCCDKFENVLVVSNPPYVSVDEWLRCDIEVRGFEPKMALVADEDGLALSKNIKAHWNRLARMLNHQQREGMRVRLFLAMETGEDHPHRIVEETSLPNGTRAIPTFKALSQSRDYPINHDFTVEDLEGRARYLCSSRCF